MQQSSSKLVIFMDMHSKKNPISFWEIASCFVSPFVLHGEESLFQVMCFVFPYLYILEFQKH